ncbi:hypothetical protein QYE76_038016 [Lolium multiflorum]|uniref:Uncharacterized protein n=1 Tax=Lolium multiflorum TaxID=4521 RepID=A0AAD8T8R6_LOLMU|nr:hypothetical protein QYE76_038016 [Lolium multiflorum]
MLGINEEPAANGGNEEEAGIGREDEESPEHGVHHDEGDADEGDDAEADGGGEAESTQTPLTSALRDPHVQELLLKDTGNTKVKAKLAQMERYFVDPKEAKLMQWHAEREKPADDPEKGKILTHPADAS